MKTSPIETLALAAALACLPGAVAAATVPIDLNAWEQRGPAGNGNWNVAPDGSSVLQTVNGNPTFFVSDSDQINTTLRGKIEVESTGDDDFVGFVFGFKSPLNTGTDMDFLLFDWKQLNQSGATEGFGLARVNGNVPNAVADPVFWDRVDDPTYGYDNLATLYGSQYGWLDNTEYEFEMLYQTGRIKIDISGGQFGTEGITVFDVAGAFQAGSFGFYNYSQAGVRYSGLTEEATPPPPPPGPNDVPEPGSLALASLALATAFGVRRRRRQK